MLERICTVVETNMIFRKYTCQYHDYLNFADVSIICKISGSFYAFSGKKRTFFPTKGVKGVIKLF